MNYYPCNSGRSSSQFTGTLEEWNALTDQEKAMYDGGDWTNDFNGSPVDATMSSSSERPLQNKVITQEFNKVYKSTDSADTTIDSADYIPFYDVSTSTMKKITVSDADFGGVTVDPTPTQGSTNAVSSGGVYSAIAHKALYFTSVACAATTGNFTTVTNTGITSDHVVVNVEYADPSAITSDVTWTTTTGSLTLNGTCLSATTCSIVLIKKDN